MNRSERKHQNIREEPRKKKKKKGEKVEIEVGGFRPLCTTQADPGHGDLGA